MLRNVQKPDPKATPDSFVKIMDAVLQEAHIPKPCNVVQVSEQHMLLFFFKKRKKAIQIHFYISHNNLCEQLEWS